MISWTNLLNQPLSINSQRDTSSNRNSPQVVVWNITSRCNLSCLHCYFSATQSNDINTMSQKEAMHFITDLAEFKVPTILFSGGEPLLRKDIFRFAQFAKDMGIRVALSTNGTSITEGIANKIKQAGFFYVGVSIDGAEETNDTFRQSKGAFKASLRGIKNCQKIGLKVGLRFTLTKYNLKDLFHVFDLVEKEAIPRFCIYHLVYSGRGKGLKEKDLNYRERREILEFIWQKALYFQQKRLNIEVLTVDNHADGVWIYLRLKKFDPQRAKLVLKVLKNQGGNSSGINIACVDNQGNVFADQFWRTHPLGNVRQRKFNTIWNDRNNTFLNSLRNRRNLLKGRCQRCNFIEICNGNFRSRAESVCGDPWADDPACYLTEEEIKEEWN